MHKPLHGGLAALALSAIILGTPAHGAEDRDKASMSQLDKYSYLQGYTLSQRLKAAGVEYFVQRNPVNPRGFHGNHIHLQRL